MRFGRFPGDKAPLAALCLAALCLAALCLAALLLAGCSPLRLMESKTLLEDIASGGGPSALKSETPPPSRQAVAFEIGQRLRRGDLYRPGEGEAEAALVLVPRVSPDGKDDARLVAFANSLARARFEVLVPDIANLRDLRVGPGDAEPIVDALRALTEVGFLPEGAGRQGEAGLLAISYAAGPALLAALEPALRGRVGFLLLIGGYYDIEAVVTYFTTGFHRLSPDAAWLKGRPDPRAKWLFLESNLALIVDLSDREALAGIALRKRRNPGADIGREVETLGREGRAVVALLGNRDPEAVPALIDALPPRILADLRGLDLSARDLSALETELMLVHGRDDPVIPYSESLALAEAASGAEVSLTLLDNLPHVDLGAPGAEDALRLWAAAYRLLEARDRLGARLTPGGS